MKTLNVPVLHAGIDDILQKLSSLNEQMKQVQTDVNAIIALEDSLKGEGGEAIRSFYQDSHQPFITFYEAFNSDFMSVLKKMKTSLQSLEPAANGYISESFIENELDLGLRTIETTTEDLTKEANDSIKKVVDIISLPKIDDDLVISQISLAKTQASDTVEKMYSFDEQQTSALSVAEEAITMMTSYIQQIESMFKSGDLTISTYSEGQLPDELDYNELKERVETEKAETSPVDTSYVGFDPLAPFNTKGNIAARAFDAKAFYDVSNKVRNGGKIEKYTTKGGQIRYRVHNPKEFGLNPPRPGRKTKLYDLAHLEKEASKGNHLKFAENVKPGRGAVAGLASKAGWVGVGISAGLNWYDSDAPTSEKITNAGVDVGIGAVSLAAGGVAAAAVVGTLGAPVIVGAAVAFAASVAVTAIFDGVKIGKGKDKKSISEHVKSGVKSIAGWFKK